MTNSRLDRYLEATAASFVIAFGCWTLLANSVVLSGGNFANLLNWTPLVLAAAVLISVVIRPPSSADRIEQPQAHGQSAETETEGAVIIRLLVGAGIAAVFAFGNSYLAFWALAATYLGYSFIRSIGAPFLARRPIPTGLNNRIALAVAMLVAVLAVVVLNRPNPDQTLGINMAVSVMDDPVSPIFAADALHGIDGAYFFPTYRVHAFELLTATIANVLGIDEPVVVFHQLLPPLLAIISVVAAARFFRLFLPRWWGWATLCLVAILLIVRETYVMYGNFGYVRLFEGKSVFIIALVPLIATYAAEFFIRPRLRTWFLLMFAQMAAVGMTANALYAGPIVAGLSLAACWRPSWTATRRLALGLTASIYPFIVSLVTRSAILTEGLGIGLESFREFIPIDEAAQLVLGDGFTLWLWLWALTSAWCILNDRASRHWVLGFSFGFTLTLMNPFLDVFWGSNVTAPYLTWRLFWVAPLPIFLAILVTNGLAKGFRENRVRAAAFATVLVAVGLTLVVDRPWDETVETRVRIGLKVPSAQYEVAERIAQIGGKGDRVLAPESVSAWVPTFRGHPYPLVARRHYTEGIQAVFSGRVDAQDLRERLLLHQFVTRRIDDAEGVALLKDWVGENKLSALAISVNHPGSGSISEILHDAGFTEISLHDYIIFALND